MEIGDAVIKQIETAGKGGFAALVFFGEIIRKRSGGVAIRRQAAVSNIVASTGVSEEELKIFRATMSGKTRKMIKEAKKKWDIAIQKVWDDHIKVLDATIAAGR
jgi:hypothetical protein